MRSIFDILHKNFQEDQLNYRRFPGLPGVVDTLFGQWPATNCAAQPTANAGQNITEHNLKDADFGAGKRIPQCDRSFIVRTGQHALVIRTPDYRTILYTAAQKSLMIYTRAHNKNEIGSFIVRTGQHALKIRTLD